MTRWLLTCDIGGTKTMLALSPLAEPAPPFPITETYDSRRFSDFETVLERFFAKHAISPTRAVIAVAGPIVGRRADVTNLPWVIDATSIARRFGMEDVALINDVEALALSVPHLRGERVLVLHPGRPCTGGAIAVVAPGTGCGEGFLVWDGTGYVAHPSESGHADFAPANAEQLGLLRYLRETHDEVFVERLCSGIGLPNIYGYLRDKKGLAEESWLADRLEAAVDRTPVIVSAALDGSSPLCVETLHWFVDILAAEARSFALRLLSTGGVFLGGGIPPRILPFLTDGRFVAGFQRGEAFAQLLRDIPISVILDPQATLDGAARRGRALASMS